MTVDDPVPTELNTSNHGPSLEIGKDKLTVRYTGDGRHPNDVGAIQANLPLPTNQLVYYFEMTVLNHGEHGRIALGFTEKSFKLTRQPGYVPGTTCCILYAKSMQLPGHNAVFLAPGSTAAQYSNLSPDSQCRHIADYCNVRSRSDSHVLGTFSYLHQLVVPHNLMGVTVSINPDGVACNLCCAAGSLAAMAIMVMMAENITMQRKGERSMVQRSALATL